jgi:yecA family protein
MSQAIYTYDELDEILRGDGHGGYVGVSAIDGLVASVVAGPVHLESHEWLPQVLAGVFPVTIEGTPEHRVVQTVLNRRKEVAEILSRRPETYLPMFMHDDGRVVIEDWTIGFMLGVGLKANAWIPLFASEARSMLAPILSANPLGRNLLPDVSDAEIDRIKTTAHFFIADAVVALHAMCSEKHNKRRRPTKHPAGRRRH